MVLVLLAALALAAAAALALTLAPRGELVTEVFIDAPPRRVWEVLADGREYGSWNPFITSMTGALVEGGRLTNVMRPGGGAAMTFTPKILVARPESELRWLGTLPVPRVFEGEHYFQLEATERGTRLRHGERFRGVALWFMSTERFRADFERMNAALKERAEGRTEPRS